MYKWFWFLCLVLTLCVGTLVARVHAQSAPAQDQPPPSAQEPMPQPDEATAFTGTIVKQQGKLILKDTMSESSYLLDDQAKAKPFVGKQVKVVGKLDADTNTIHVQTIEEVAS
jgi:hypothetical protein